MLSVARRRALDSHLGVAWIEGDAAAPPVEPASFDAILARHLVWTLPDPGRTLEAWRSVVVPGGLIAVIDGWYPSPPFPGRVAGGLARRWLASHPQAGAHEHPYLPEQLARLPLAHQGGTDQIARLLAGAGLTHVRVRPLPEVDRVERAHQGALERLADPWRRYLATAQRPRP
jgi:SAM-dependent methyltransferase